MGKVNEKRNLERKRARYAKDFKLKAVRLLELRQKPAWQLALELGLCRNQLYKWRHQIKSQGVEAAFPGAGRKRLHEQSEVERLRRKLKKVTEERDILKRATAYFDMKLP